MVIIPSPLLLVAQAMPVVPPVLQPGERLLEVSEQGKQSAAATMWIDHALVGR